MRLLLGACAAVLLFASGAEAWAPDVWQTSLGIARISWPDSPCLGREQIIVVKDLGPNINGDATQDGCLVHIRRGLPDYGLCVVMVHEFGHLAGRTHADVYDHEGVMGEFPATYSPCEEVDPFGLLRYSPRVEAARLFSVAPKRCKLATATPTRRLYRCGHRAHAVVILSAGRVVEIDRVETP